MKHRSSEDKLIHLAGEAVSNRPEPGSLESRVMRACTEVAGGMTDHTLSLYCTMPKTKIRQVRAQLIAGGWLEASGKYQLTIFGEEEEYWTGTDKSRYVIANDL